MNKNVYGDQKLILPNKYPPANRGKIVVWGLLAAYPFGGMTWQVLHYLSGLRRLGFDVWYVEDSDRNILSPTTWNPTLDISENLDYLSRYMEMIGFKDRWIFRPQGVRDTCFGATDSAGLKKLYKEADVVLNLCGAQEWKQDHEIIRCLVYLQTDPVEAQIQVAERDQAVIKLLDNYHYLFTYGENIGASDCSIPAERYHWISTRPPVCVDWWNSPSVADSEMRLTTIGNWNTSGKDVVWKNETYFWRKDYKRFITLPNQSALPLELALVGISEKEADKMHSHCWHLSSAKDLSNPIKYRDYICGSLAEFTVAKDQYVRFRSGWFSDRSVCYLAAGRPVITEDTGFANFIPTGTGLFSFTNMDQIVEAIDAIHSDYEKHSRAAKEIAKEYFSVETVLAKLIDDLGL